MGSNVQKIGSRVSFYNVVFDGEYGWFCDVYTNTLCRISMATASISIEAMIPFDGDIRPFQYGFIARAGNLLVLAPRSAFTVLLYNMGNKTFKKIDIDADRVEQVGAYNLFAGVKVYDGNAYLIPGRFGGIIKINLSTAEITYLDDWYALLKTKVVDFDLKRVMFARCNCNVKNKIYLPCWQSSIIMVFDLETDKYSFLELPTLDMPLSSMCIIDDEIWLASPNSNRIFLLDREGKEIERIVVDGIEETGIAFLEKCGQLLYVVPTYGNQLVCLNMQTKECQNILNLATEASNMPKELVFAQTNMLSCVRDDQEQLWMYSIFDGKILKCSANGNAEIYNAVLEKKEDVRRRSNHYVKAHILEDIIMENDQCSLEDFLGYVSEG